MYYRGELYYIIYVLYDIIYGSDLQRVRGTRARTDRGRPPPSRRASAQDHFRIFPFRTFYFRILSWSRARPAQTRPPAARPTRPAAARRDRMEGCLIARCCLIKGFDFKTFTASIFTNCMLSAL